MAKLIKLQMGTHEKKPPVSIDHYKNKYWNDLPEVKAYMSENATGDPNQWWTSYVKQRYAKTPFKNALIVGCGNGRIEREMYDLGIAEEFDAFDCSDRYIEEAEKNKKNRPITYQNISFASFSPKKKYELVVNVASLHHVYDLDELIKKISDCMPPYGLFINWDYIGPNRMQYPDDQLELMEDFNNYLPPKYKTENTLRNELQVFLKGDITEGVRAFEILPTFEKYFEIIENRDIGGGLAYEILFANIEEFEKDVPEAKGILQELISKDRELTKNRTIQSSFGFFVGRPRKYTQMLKAKVRDSYIERLEQQLTQQIDINKHTTNEINKIEQDKQMTASEKKTIFQRLKNLFF